MVKAALTIPEESEGEDQDTEHVGTDNVLADEVLEESSIEVTGSINDGDRLPEEVTYIDEADDFGSYLTEAYGIEDTRSGSKKGPIILGGSLQDALQTARQQARLLVLFIPSERPKGESWSFFGGKKNQEADVNNDQIAIESLISVEVGKAANKKAYKRSENGFGSFAIWGCKAGSLEATSAIKRLKLKTTSSKGGKRPILCVVYPGVVSLMLFCCFCRLFVFVFLHV